MYPHDPAAPVDLVANCVPGDSLVVASEINGAIRSLYVGDVVTLEWQDGNVFTCTPYHPVLTEFGWVPAKDIKQGHHLVRAFRHDPLAEAYPDVKRHMPTAEQIYNSLALSGGSNRVEGLTVNLHGDTVDGYVDVVTTDWPLSVDLNPALGKEFDQFCLTCADAPIASDSPEFHFAVAPRDTTDSGMGFGDLIQSLIFGHPRPLHQLGFGSRTPMNPPAFEPEIDDMATDSQSLADGVDRFPVKVSLEEVFNVGRRHFMGHMYSFETRSGIYFADQIVSHNCRCGLVIVRAEDGRG